MARPDEVSGFSLVEVVVGLGIGMMAMTVIMQVFAVFEGGKRSTTAGADAQINGATALYLIEQDARMAGWGLDSALYGDCVSTFTYCDGSAACGGGEGALKDFSFAAVTVQDGGAGPDTVSAQFFANPVESTFRLPGQTRLDRTMLQPSAELDVASISGCEAGDLVLVAQAGNCTLLQITHIQEQALKFQHSAGAGGPFNPPASYQQANGWPAYAAGARLSCLKPPETQATYRRTYAIDASRQLMRTEGAATELVAPDIMDLQAQYGIAPPKSNTVTEWVDAGTAPWNDPSSTEIGRIKALRLALVARSAQYEKPRSGASCTTTTQETVNAWPSWAKFDTSRYPADWQCYRYKVVETVVPLRNRL